MTNNMDLIISLKPRDLEFALTKPFIVAGSRVCTVEENYRCDLGAALLEKGTRPGQWGWVYPCYFWQGVWGHCLCVGGGPSP